MAANGAKYTGEWVEGKKHGKGVYVSAQVCALPGLGVGKTGAKEGEAGGREDGRGRGGEEGARERDRK